MPKVKMEEFMIVINHNHQQPIGKLFIDVNRFPLPDILYQIAESGNQKSSLELGGTFYKNGNSHRLLYVSFNSQLLLPISSLTWWQRIINYIKGLYANRS